MLPDPITHLRMWILLFHIFFHFHVLFAIPSFDDDAPIPLSNMYVFGDSNFVAGGTPGNDSWMKTGYMPYGSSCDYIGSDRFSDGITIPEFVAVSLGLGLMDPMDQLMPTLLDGANFASASAGILPETGTAFGKNVCFKEQIRVFKEHMEKGLEERYQAKKKEISKYLSNSFFLINIGASDYIFNYLQPNNYNTSKRYNGEEFAELLTNEYSKYIKDLHKLGARNMVIFEISPLGCLPYMIEKLKPTSKCAENINDLVIKFNNKLDIKLKELRKELEDSHILIARMFSLIKNMIETPANYGFEETRWPCCPIDKNNTGLCKKDVFRIVSDEELRKPLISPEEEDYYNRNRQMCEDYPMSESLKKSKKWTGPNNDSTCKYKRLYIFFDELHLTQAANRVIKERLIAGIPEGSISPIGIYQLARTRSF